MATTAQPGLAEILTRVERIRPVIERHRDEAEQRRRLSDEVIAAMQAEGLFNLWLPREYGGVEVDLLTYLKTIEAICRIDASAGWVFTILATNASQAAFLPQAGARQVYGSGALTAGSTLFGGRAVPVEGGYRVNGQWALASGCHHADWLAANCLIFDGDAPRTIPGDIPDCTMMFIPTEQCTILDTWHSTGLRGTGSHDFAVDDVFVPVERSFSLFTAQSHVAGSLYRMRLEMSFFMAVATCCLGVARAAVDAFVELAREKTPTLSQTVLSSRPVVHAAVARTEAQYQAARAFLHEVAGGITAAITAGESVPEAIEVRRRLACNYVAEACEAVVDSMYRLGGSTSVRAGERLDRCLRDIHTINQHLAVSPAWWEKTGQSYFGLGLGMP